MLPVVIANVLHYELSRVGQGWGGLGKMMG